jgi:hypothetical protein
MFKLLLLQRLPDGVRLRGDIHALLLGDPSTAKSQASIGWRIIACSLRANNMTRKLIYLNSSRGVKKLNNW